MSNLTIGENYFVLVQRGDPAVCTRAGCTYSERSILYQLKFFPSVIDCLDGIISGGTLPAPGPINLEYFAFNAYYFSRGFTMFECETLCLSAACNNSTLLNFLDFYDVTITGPSGVFNDAAILALGGCFSNLLPGNYQMTFTDNGNVNFLGTVPFTVIPENHSSVDVSISTNSVICSPSDFLASISVSGLSYYEYVDYIIDCVVVNINNLPSSAFTEGVHEFCVEGLDRCSEDPDRDCVFYTVQAVPSFATIVNCNTVQITNNTTCSQLVNSWFWNFGNGQTSTSVNPPQVTYATGGTYTITLTIITNGGNTYSYSQTVQVNSLPQGLITGNDNLCSTSAFNYVLSGIVPGTINWYVFPVSAGNVFSGINSSTATVVWNSGWNGLAIVGASGVDANGCPFDVSIKINPCCLPIPSGANFSDPSATTNVSSYYSIWPFVVGGGSGQLTGQTVYIYNDLVIDQTTSFVNCTLYVAPGKRILVAPGRTIS
ncbi:MAG: PKD domain-containing protein, partial [Flavobacteriales bacterium]